MSFHAYLVGALLLLAIAAVASASRARAGVPYFPLLVLVAVAVRMGIGGANLAYGPFPGAETDAVTFEAFGATLAQDWREGNLHFFGWSFNYVNVVAAVYFVTGRAPMIITLLNALLVVFTMVNVVHVLRAVEVPARRHWLALAFIALYPAGVLYSAVPLREAVIVWGLSLYLRGVLTAPMGSEWTSARAWVGMVVAFTFHTGFVVLVPFTFLVPMIRAGLIRQHLRSRRRAPRVIGALLLLLGCTLLANNYLYLANIPKIGHFFSAEGGFEAEMLEQVQARKFRGDGAYRLHFPKTGVPPLDAVLVMPEAAGRLLFSPLPWESSLSFGQLFKLVDVAIQLLLVLGAAAALRQPGRPAGLRVPAALVLVLAVTFGFGTGNDGVAIRHRAKFTWVTAAVAAAAGAFPGRRLVRVQRRAPSPVPAWVAEGT